MCRYRKVPSDKCEGGFTPLRIKETVNRHCGNSSQPPTASPYSETPVSVTCACASASSCVGLLWVCVCLVYCSQCERCDLSGHNVTVFFILGRHTLWAGFCSSPLLTHLIQSINGLITGWWVESVVSAHRWHKKPTHPLGTSASENTAPHIRWCIASHDKGL